MATAAAPLNTDQRIEVLDFKQIHVDDIENNEKNPRPKYHLTDDNPDLIALGDSIKSVGQHQLATVYEIVDHYEDDDQPGRYRLLAGESRWRACRIAGVEYLYCTVVRAPSSHAEEIEAFGMEEAFKRDWQQFFKLKNCYELAQELGVPVDSVDISTKTGVKMSDLKIAKKMFKLHPSLHVFVAEYEKAKYEYERTGERQSKTTDVKGASVKVHDFSAQKAALVYDIFTALRTNVPTMVKQYGDLDLQLAIAGKAGRASIRELEQFYGLLRTFGGNPPPGTVSEILTFLQNPKRTVKDSLRASGAEEAAKLNKFLTMSTRIRKLAGEITKSIDQIGNDPKALQEIEHEALYLTRDVHMLERELMKRREQLEKGQR